MRRRPVIGGDWYDRQWDDARLRPRFGAHVVNNKADVLQFHSVPDASDSRVGVVVRIGSIRAAPASAANTSTSNARFMSAIPRLAARRYRPGERLSM
jgi:hypothetical protein